MRKLISGLAIFLAANIVAGFFYCQHGLGGDFDKYFPAKSSVPLIILNCGPVVYVFTMWLCSIYMRHNKQKKNKFPTVLEDDIGNIKYSTVLERLSFFFTVIFPLLGFLWMWQVFYEQVSWATSNPSIIVGL